MGAGLGVGRADGLKLEGKGFLEFWVSHAILSASGFRDFSG